MRNLQQLFNNSVFRIPDYQRGYAWGHRQLQDFWSDLKRVVNNQRDHYCGQLTLEKVNNDAWRQWNDDRWLVEPAGYEPYFVVDGQQRLTTAIILLRCLIEDLSQETTLSGFRVSELNGRYLVREDGVLRSCLFGYERDNPSHEFFRTQILGVPSNEYHGTNTVYTNNLAQARDFFRGKIGDATSPVNREHYLQALVQRFRFNVHELPNDIDVFVAFETMNNRGKPLSRLELLKNRLIYLSTLAEGTEEARRTVRNNINAVWRTIYEELGRNPTEPLDDDDFLRAHWIVFFGHDRAQADPLTQFLLNEHFTTERLDQKELTLKHIQNYVDSLQQSALVWQRLHFPENNHNELGEQACQALVRLKRLDFGVLKPLLLAVLQSNDVDRLNVFCQAERFLLLVRNFASRRADVAEAESYRFAHTLHTPGLLRDRNAVAQMLANRVEQSFSPADFQAVIDGLFKDGNGFYDLRGLKFVLFEYEESLRRQSRARDAKVQWEDCGERNSVEHIYPQNPIHTEWPLFANLSDDQRRFVTHSLGNLVVVSVARNAALARRSFRNKKQGTDNIPGYRGGSFSENKIAQYDDWGPDEILQRGIEMLTFIETRWQVTLGDNDAKASLLKLEFLRNH